MDAEDMLLDLVEPLALAGLIVLSCAKWLGWGPAGMQLVALAWSLVA